ncbi:Amf1p [Sugiyamaella lignohabitans]|uniref:Amf1p n=1 Tax=Sugiyamaella lignohabitans TaxID=796027 RepID=A0A161HKG2_9ASCO|nr:Amf1p [Sugiyamaella lignohabitans]ANB13477.1 Amf1p [Sugiyamaella lignohabitans]
MTQESASQKQPDSPMSGLDTPPEAIIALPLESLKTINKIRIFLRPFSLIVFSGAQILDILNVTGLMFSTRTIAETYGVSIDTASWVISAYSLTYGSFILMGGRLADYVGHRLVFTVGMTLVALCCLVGAVSHNIYVLFVFRALQGVGAALTIPTSFALVAHTFTGRTQAIAFAIVGSCAAMGGIVGVLVGGGFAGTSIGYHGLLYLSFGLSCFFLFMPFFSVEETPTNKEKLNKLDWVGSIIIVCGVILVVFGFTSAPGRWKSARVIAPIIIGVLLIAFFAYYETFLAEKLFNFEPLLPRYAWSFQNLAVVFAMSPLVFANLFVVLFAGSNEMTGLMGLSPMHSAVNFISLGVSFIIACVIGGASYGKIPSKILLVAGPLLNIIAAALMAHIDNHSYWRFLFPATIFISFGCGFFMATFINVVSNSAPLDHQGLVNGICQTGGQLGVAISLAIATSEMGDGLKASSFQATYYTLLAYSALAFLIGIIFIKSDHPNVGQQAEAKLVDEEVLDEKNLPETTNEVASV